MALLERHGQWCSDWFGGWIWAGACQLGGYWRTWCSSFVQTDRFLHLQATLLKAVRLHPHRGQQLARSQGWTVSLHKNLFLRNWEEGRERKLDGAAKKVGSLCVHVRILSVFRHFGQRISRNRQAEAKVFTIMSATHLLLTSKEAIHETSQKKRSF